MGAIIIKKITLLVLCGLISLSMTSNSIKAKQLEEKRTVKVAYTEFGNDFTVDKDGNPNGGYTYEVVMKLAQYAGWNVEFVKSDKIGDDNQIVDLMQKVSLGQCDMMGLIYRNDQMQELYNYSDRSYGESGLELLGLQGPDSIDNSALTNGSIFKIALLEQGASARQALSDYCDHANIKYEEVLCKTEDERYQYLLSGQADLMLTTTLEAAQYNNIFSLASFDLKPFFFVVTKDNQELFDELNSALYQLNYLEPQFKSNLKNKYFSTTKLDNELTDDETDYLKSKGFLKVLVPYNIPPQVYKGDDNEYYGIFISFMDYLLEETGLNVEYYSLNEGETLADAMTSGKYDFALSVNVSYTYALSRNIIYSEPLISSGTAMFYNKLADISDLSKLKFAKATSYPYNPSLYNEIVTYNTIEECLEAVQNGDADFGFGSALNVNYQINHKGYSNVSYTILDNTQNSFALAYPIDSEAIFMSAINKIIRGIDSVRINSFIAENEKYQSSELLMHYFRGNPLLGAFILIIIILLIIFTYIMIYFLRKLKAKNKALITASHAKTDFLSNMSHDMRTPMNGIIGIVNLLKERNDLPEEVRIDLLAIDDSANYLLTLINDTLDMSKIESGKLSLNRETINAQDLINNIVITVTPAAKEKGVNLEIVPINAELDYILADKIRLQQIFVNVLSNAIKFTPSGGTVRMEIECLKRVNGIAYDRISVEDNGIGMSPEFLPRIFDTFTQENNPNAPTKTTGTGLGMAIVKNLIEQMYGTIQVESKLGVGTKVTAYINFERVYDVQEKEETENINNVAYLDGKRILLCEDHPLNTKITMRLLESKNIIVEHAENGKIALEMFAKSDPGYYGAILMDIRTPIMNGLEASVAIRALNNKDATRIPIIAMTANAFDEDKQKSKEAGMNAHLSKPIKPAELFNTLISEIHKAEHKNH